MAYKRTGLTLKQEEYDALVGKLKEMGYSCLSEFVREGILKGKALNLDSKGQPVQAQPSETTSSNPSQD